MAVKPPVSAEPAFDSSKLYLWVKALETKANNLLREVDVFKNDYVKKNAQLRKDMKIVSDDILEFRREQQQLQQQMDLMIKELKQTAGIEEVAVLRKYMEFWNPMNFVTQRDLERALDAKIAVLKEMLSPPPSASPPEQERVAIAPKKDYTPFH